MNRTDWTRAVVLLVGLGTVLGPTATAAEKAPPDKVYVPYEKLKDVFGSAKQGVFLPYGEFQRLWRAAQGTPAGVGAAPVPYLVSTARFTGRVAAELATMQMRLTVDVLADGWVEVPIGLAQVAVSGAAFRESPEGDTPLLRVVKGQYRLVTRGRGRRVLDVQFARQLTTQPGLNVLAYRMPSAAVTTLELLIPEANMKVDVDPMLAATTSQVADNGKKATRLQAFLGSADHVKLSWKPTTQAAEALEPVVISDQVQHIHVAEALVAHEVRFTYDIRRRGVDAFTIQLPREFRVTAVTGANIAKWDVTGGAATTQPAGAAGTQPAVQLLHVKLFAPAKDRYTLAVKMERFLKEDKAVLALTPVVTHRALRQTGLVAITHAPRRSVEVRQARNLPRVDPGRLPADLRKQAGVTAYRFIAADYGAELAIGSVAPRITPHQRWALGVSADRLELRARLQYTIDRAGVFELGLRLPEPWTVLSVGPSGLVDDRQVTGKGAERTLVVLLKREVTGTVTLDLVARAPRSRPDQPVRFALPVPVALKRTELRMCTAHLDLWLAPQFRAEIDKLDQFQSVPLARGKPWTTFAGLSPALAFDLRALDRARPAGAAFKIAVKPAQVSAVVHRLVNIQPGSIDEQAVVQFRIRHAPVDTFYLKMPRALADQVRIDGRDIKEQPRIDRLPSARGATTRPARAATAPSTTWAYFKIVLQSPVINTYQLTVTTRRSFQAGEVGRPVNVKVEPILAAGTLSDQGGHIAVVKADTLAIGAPVATGLTPGDPGSPTDLPYAPHRRSAVLAFKYTTPPFALSLPVVTQKESDVFTKIVSAAIIEQVVDRKGTLNTHAIYLLATSRGGRLALTLPTGAKLFSVLLNGSETGVEAGTTADQRIVPLPPSAGQVSRFVLEVSYGLDDASAANLTGPELDKDIPVQQTLWRLWVPQEDYVVSYDRTFARLARGEADALVATLSSGQPSRVAFKLAPQGRLWDFARQGPPGRLTVRLVGKEVFGIVLWLIILAAGAAMLKLDGFRRCLIVLAVVVVASVIHLFAPLLVRRAVGIGSWAGVIVLLLWLSQWVFLRRRRARQALQGAAPPSAEPPMARVPGEPATPEPPAEGTGDAPEGEEDGHEQK